MNTDLETWLQDKFAKMGEALGRETPLSALRIAPPLAEWEANYFVLGLEEDLFQVNERSEIDSLFLHGEPEGDLRPYRIFSSEPPRLLRENVCQLAAAARLIIERGWLPRHVVLEPGQPQYHSHADHFDLLVRSPDSGKIFIWVEVRRTTVELEKLIADLRACSRRGPHAHEDCGFPQNHPRHEFCVANQPAYIWAVAPNGEIAFAVNCMGTILELAPLSSLPPRSLFELGKA